MQSIQIQRGFNDRLYFVAKDDMSESDIVFEVHFTKNSDQEYTSKEAYKVRDGSIIALEMNPDNMIRT